MSEARIGTQGWNYDDWVGPFYPRGTRSSEFLDLYSRLFDTVEVDSTFYAVPSESVIGSWRARAPAGFIFSLKLHQQMTHGERLRNCAGQLEEFCGRARGLGENLGALLIQLPPDFSPRSWEALEKFILLLPPDIQFAVELRDPAWFSGLIFERLNALLSSQGVALALVDGNWIPRKVSLKLVDCPTAGFAYLRWMGPRVLTEFSHVQVDRDRELKQWAEGVVRLGKRVERIYGYFNNYFQGHSPASCNQLKKLIGQPVIEPETLIRQPSLFQML
jgi:uncharacterized protein YecE (DUF72 family)